MEKESLLSNRQFKSTHEQPDFFFERLCETFSRQNLQLLWS